MQTTTHKEDALAFLKFHTLGALATLSPEGEPHVRLAYYAGDETFATYFMSLANTRKVADIHANPKAAFVVSSEDKAHTLQIEGVFEEITDTATFGPILAELTKHLYPNEEPSAPITHMDASHPVLYKLTPTWIRWGDFTHGTHTNEVMFEIDLK